MAQGGAMSSTCTVNIKRESNVYENKRMTEGELHGLDCL